MNLLQESEILKIMIMVLEVDDLERENAEKDKELAKLNKAISKSKSKKEAQALVEELISFISFIQW